MSKRTEAERARDRRYYRSGKGKATRDRWRRANQQRVNQCYRKKLGEKKDAGLCLRNGCHDAATSGIYCEYHAKLNREKTARYTAFGTSRGLRDG